MAPIPGNNREEPERGKDDDKAVSSLDTPQFNIQGGSSDSEQDDEGDSAYAGYQPLPQEPGGEVSDNAVQDVEEEPSASGSNSEAILDRLIMRSLNNQDFAEASAPASQQEDAAPPEIPMELAERKELWSSTKSPSENIKIDSEKANKIKAAMVGFKLPTTHVPEWAKVIPEEQWKTKLIDRLSKSSRSGTDVKNASQSDRSGDSSSTSQEKNCPDEKT